MFVLQICHRITGWLELDGTLRGHLVALPVLSGDTTALSVLRAHPLTLGLGLWWVFTPASQGGGGASQGEPHITVKQQK